MDTLTNRLRQHTIVLTVLIFLFAFAVRILSWQDNHQDVLKVQSSVTARYKESARQLVTGDFKTFVTDVQRLGHPPGYPIFLAIIFKLAGKYTTIQFVQMVVDGVAVVVVFMIALELFKPTIAIITALLAALSPQFSYFSVLVLPDSLVVLPILLAAYFIIRSRKHYSTSSFLIAGALVGLSCWFRANALLLPIFLALLAFCTTTRSKRISAAIAIIVGAVAVIAPITIKNAVVFHRFIPLSLGTGQTLLEGIADYDEQNRFNVPKTDVGLARQEAETWGRPSYAEGLFNEDGIERDRRRVARGFQIIKSNPLWFMSVVGSRALASTRLDPVPRLRPEAPVSHRVDILGPPSWQNTPDELLQSEHSPNATLKIADNKWLSISGDDQAYGNQITSTPIRVEPFQDYVLSLPFKLEQGRAGVKITSVDGGDVLAWTVVDVVEGIAPHEQPANQLTIPFVSAKHTELRLVIANNAAIHSMMLVGTAQIVPLGPSSVTWLRYLRMPLRTLQRFFTTALVLPLVVLGVGLLVVQRRWQELAILLVVPAYYLIVQSVLHTERRYVYIIQYFFLILVSMVLCWIFEMVVKRTRSRRTTAP